MSASKKDTDEPQIKTRARTRGTVKESGSDSWVAAQSESKKKRSNRNLPMHKSIEKVSPRKSSGKKKASKDSSKSKSKRRRIIMSVGSDSFEDSTREPKKADILSKSLSNSYRANSPHKSRVSNNYDCVVKIDNYDTTSKDGCITIGVPQRTPKQSPEHLLSSKHSMKTSILLGTPGSTSKGIRKSKSLRKYSSPSKHVPRRFSKSPKIVLRSPRSKSKSKSKSAKLNVSRKSIYSKDVGKRRSSKGSPKTSLDDSRKKTEKKSKLVDKETPKRRPMVNLLPHHADIMRKQPIVLLQRISLADNVTLSSTELKNPSGASLKKKRPGDRLSRKQTEQLIAKTLKSVTPLMASTPIDEKARSSLQGKKQGSAIRSRTNRSVVTTDTTVVKTPIVPDIRVDANSISNESEPSFHELDMSEATTPQKTDTTQQTPSRRNSSRLRKELTVTLEDVHNNTYDVLEPKTPRLREKQGKRSFLEADLPQPSAKKRFESPKMKSPGQRPDSAKTTKKPSQSPPTPKSKLPRLLSIENTKSSKGLIKSPDKHSSHLNTADAFTTPAKASPRINRKSPLFITNRTKTELSIYKQPVSGTKYSASKKPPNFAEIHRRMFSKAESISDAKKRLEERHKAFSRIQVVQSIEKARPKSAPHPRNPACNRFGFGLRKSDAMEAIVGKRRLLTKEKQKEETRAAVKGVRTNRRFELLMKARKMDL